MMLKGLGQLGDMGKLMKTAKDMQDKMKAAQESLDAIEVTGEAGAGLVKAVASARGDLKSIEINASLFNAEDKEVVEDLILAAVRDAQARAAERGQQEMAKITGGMGLPEGMKLPF